MFYKETATFKKKLSRVKETQNFWNKLSRMTSLLAFFSGINFPERPFMAKRN